MYVKEKKFLKKKMYKKNKSVTKKDVLEKNIYMLNNNIT
jgi:hypothetical protein